MFDILPYCFLMFTNFFEGLGRWVISLTEVDKEEISTTETFFAAYTGIDNMYCVFS